MKPAPQKPAPKKPPTKKPAPQKAAPQSLALTNHDRYSDDTIADILREARVFAFVGASANTSRPSYFAMKYLLGKGYTIHPLSAGQLIDVDHKLAVSGNTGDVKQRRRIEIRLRRLAGNTN